MTDRKRARGRRSRGGRGFAELGPMTRGELEQGVTALVMQHERGQLSLVGLIDSLVILAADYIVDKPEQQDARAAVLAELDDRHAWNQLLDEAHAARKRARRAYPG